MNVANPLYRSDYKTCPHRSSPSNQFVLGLPYIKPLAMFYVVILFNLVKGQLFTSMSTGGPLIYHML